MSIYEIEVPTVSGDVTTLEDYKGQLLLIVNTASGCGLAPQFEGLEKLYLEFKDKDSQFLDSLVINLLAKSLSQLNKLSHIAN